MFSWEHFEEAERLVQSAKDRVAKPLADEEMDGAWVADEMRPYLELADVHIRLARMAFEAEQEMSMMFHVKVKNPIRSRVTDAWKSALGVTAAWKDAVGILDDDEKEG